MNNFRYFISILIVLFSLNSCKSDDDSLDNSLITGNGNLTLKFENGFGSLGPITLNSTTQTSTNSQKHQFSTLKYIVSNIVLIKEDGSEVKYNYNNPDLGAFIIDQADAVGGTVNILLSNIPAANYTKIKIGLGISPQAYLLGQSGQANFLEKATIKDLFWTWASGYIFVMLEGKYGTSTANTNFLNHIGNFGDVTTNGTPNMYREITMSLPVSAKVRKEINPAIHIKVDWNKYLDGVTPIKLSTINNDLHGSSPGLITVADNLTQAFSVDHVHND